MQVELEELYYLYQVYIICTKLGHIFEIIIKTSMLTWFKWKLILNSSLYFFYQHNFLKLFFSNIITFLFPKTIDFCIIFFVFPSY